MHRRYGIHRYCGKVDGYRVESKKRRELILFSLYFLRCTGTGIHPSPDTGVQVCVCVHNLVLNLKLVSCIKIVLLEILLLLYRPTTIGNYSTSTALLFCSHLFTVYCLLFTVYCLLFTVCCLYLY